MFSNDTSTANPSAVAMANFQYRQTTPSVLAEMAATAAEESKEPEIRLTEKALADRLAAARATGFAEAEAKMRQEFDQKSAHQAERIAKTIADFEKAQKEYFSRVEAEVVQLALAIAGKILHREAQVDPMLIAAIVHLALGQLKEGSSASIRVRPEQTQRWREHFTAVAANVTVRVVEDADLEPGDCVLDTELGTVNFSLNAQLKEVERGFFDVLAQKPQV